MGQRASRRRPRENAEGRARRHDRACYYSGKLIELIHKVEEHARADAIFVRLFPLLQPLRSAASDRTVPPTGPASICQVVLANAGREGVPGRDKPVGEPSSVRHDHSRPGCLELSPCSRLSCGGSIQVGIAISARLRGVEKDEIIGEDVRLRRLTRIVGSCQAQDPAPKGFGTNRRGDLEAHRRLAGLFLSTGMRQLLRQRRIRREAIVL